MLAITASLNNKNIINWQLYIVCAYCCVYKHISNKILYHCPFIENSINILGRSAKELINSVASIQHQTKCISAELINYFALSIQFIFSFDFDFSRSTNTNAKKIYFTIDNNYLSFQLHCCLSIYLHLIAVCVPSNLSVE